MAHFFFFLATVAASLLWTAAFTAAAARVKTFGWLLRIIAVGIPLLAWLPWLAFTAWLVERKVPTNWFGPTLTAFLSTLIGGLWIVSAGLSARGRSALGHWSIPGLAAGFGAALLAAGTTLAVVEQDLERWANGLRAEATGMMASVVPPPLSPDANAATLYREAMWLSKTAFAIPSKQIEQLFGVAPIPVDSAEVGDVLKRQAPLIDLIRRGTAREECRFDRDWSRPTISMLLPETQEMRHLARLLALSARRQAVDGHPAEALADVERLGRMAKHSAREPFLVCSFVGIALDSIALAALAEVLPHVTHAEQLDAIDPLGFSQATELRHAANNSLVCEEAMFLNTAAELADKRLRWSKLGDDFGGTAPGMTTPFGVLPNLEHWLDPLYRTFMLRSDIDDFRTRFERFAHGFSGWLYERRDPDGRRRHLKELMDLDGAGPYAKLFMPAFSQMNTAAWRSEARRNIAGVLLAATRYRLATGALPESLESLVLDYLPSAPVDVFAQDDASLKLVSTDSAWTVYSIGNNGRDDGGPQPDGSEPFEGKDDIGLSMKR
jgi:hypothetical protein